jgi:hypothetical protein
MDSREPAGLKARRALQLQEIALYRHAIRSHAVAAKARTSEIGHNVHLAVRAFSVAPAAVTFLLGLVRGRGSRHSERSGRGHGLRGLFSTVMAGYAVWKLVLKH